MLGSESAPSLLYTDFSFRANTSVAIVAQSLPRAFVPAFNDVFPFTPFIQPSACVKGIVPSVTVPINSHQHDPSLLLPFVCIRIHILCLALHFYRTLLLVCRSLAI
jgi:hypothetical protein